jgi:hypothetical protein
MDRGDILKRDFLVIAGRGGSFVVRTDYNEGDDEMGSFLGFDNVDSLIRWLQDEAEGLKASGPQPPST